MFHIARGIHVMGRRAAGHSTTHGTHRKPAATRAALPAHVAPPEIPAEKDPLSGAIKGSFLEAHLEISENAETTFRNKKRRFRENILARRRPTLPWDNENRPE